MEQAPAATPVAAPAPTQNDRQRAPNNQQQSPDAGGEEQSRQGAPSEEKPADKEQQRYHKVKVNGKERTISEAEMLRNYSKSLAADERMLRASQIEKSQQAFWEALQNDPEKVLNDPRLPIKKRDLAMKWLREQVSQDLDEPTDPRDIKLREVERELSRYKEEETNKQKSAEQKEREAFINQRREAIAADLTKALDLSAFGKDDSVKAEVLEEMARYMRVCRQQGYDVTPKELAEHIQSKHFNRYALLADAHSGEELSQLLGEKVVKKLIQAEIKRRQSSRDHGQAPDVAESWQSGPKARREFIDPDELKRRR